MSVSAGAINLLEDVVGTLYCDGTGDTGVTQVSFSASAVVNMDKVSTKKSATTVDHSGGQSADEMHRGNKRQAELTFEGKMLVGYGAGAYANLDVLKQVKFVVLGTIGAGSEGDSFQGIITEIDKEYAGPSTFKFTMKPYGTQMIRTSA